MRLVSPLLLLASIGAGALSLASLVVPMLDHTLTADDKLAIALSTGLVVLTIIVAVKAHQAGLLTAAGFSLALVAATGSGLTVWEQWGRRGQTRDTASLTLTGTAADRTRLTNELRGIEKTLAFARPDATSECLGAPSPLPPNGWPVCRRKQGTVLALDARRKDLDTTLRALPLAVAPDAKTERVVTATRLTIGTKAAEEAARTWVWLLDPAALPVWLELLSIVCGIFAFGARPEGRAPAVPAAANDDRPADRPAEGDRPATVRPDRDRPASSGDAPATGRTDRKTLVLREIIAGLSAGRSAGSSAELCRRHDVARATMSDWRREWEAAGLIPPARTVGRCKTLPAERPARPRLWSAG